MPDTPNTVERRNAGAEQQEMISGSAVEQQRSSSGAAAEQQPSSSPAAAAAQPHHNLPVACRRLVTCPHRTSPGINHRIYEVASMHWMGPENEAMYNTFHKLCIEGTTLEESKCPLLLPDRILIG